MMRFEIDNTESNVRVTVTHTSGSTDLRLTWQYQGSQQAAFRNVLTRTEARALAGGILALLDEKPEAD